MTINPSTAHYPSIDDHTERVNVIIEAYLRAFVNYMQDDWSEWLDMSEFVYNNSKHTASGFSLFFLKHGYDADMEYTLEVGGVEKIIDVDTKLYAAFMKELHNTAVNN